MAFLRKNKEEGGVVMSKDSYYPVLNPDSGYLVSGIKIIDTDPMGSYTGRASDPYEKPIQDADDL